LDGLSELREIKAQVVATTFGRGGKRESVKSDFRTSALYDREQSGEKKRKKEKGGRE